MRVGETGVGEMGVGEMGQIIGETGVGETGVGEMGVIRYGQVDLSVSWAHSLFHFCPTVTQL